MDVNNAPPYCLDTHAHRPWASRLRRRHIHVVKVLGADGAAATAEGELPVPA